DLGGVGRRDRREGLAVGGVDGLEVALVAAVDEGAADEVAVPGPDADRAPLGGGDRSRAPARSSSGRFSCALFMDSSVKRAMRGEGSVERAESVDREPSWRLVVAIVAARDLAQQVVDEGAGAEAEPLRGHPGLSERLGDEHE